MPAKKAVKPADPKHHEAKDLRRSYEHLGRVEVLQRALQPATSKDIHSLVGLAQQQLGKGHRKHAADLLRAAEHFSFAALVSAELKPNGASPELLESVKEEVNHLTRKANEHWDEHGVDKHHAWLTALFHSSIETAMTALDSGSYRQALELARGAEALAHGSKHGPEELGSGKPKPKLPKP